VKSRACKILFAVLVIVGVAPSNASADGLPVPVDVTFGEGVISADGSDRFVTIATGDKTTTMKISTEDGEVEDYQVADGWFTVPAIAVDGTASGISADGTTLALINPRRAFPRESTDFLVFQ